MLNVFHMDAQGDRLLVLEWGELNSTTDRILSQFVFDRLVLDLNLISCDVDIVLLIVTVLVDTVAAVLRVLHVTDADADRDRRFLFERRELEPATH